MKQPSNKMLGAHCHVAGGMTPKSQRGTPLRDLNRAACEAMRQWRIREAMRVEAFRSATNNPVVP